MKHGRKNKRFGRKDNVRLGFLRSIAIALIENGQIKTTEMRAKAIAPFTEKLITIAKRGDLVATRMINAKLGNNRLASNKLIKEIAPKFADRDGGYTRIIKLPARAGDASPMAIVEFVE